MKAGRWLLALAVAVAVSTPPAAAALGGPRAIQVRAGERQLMLDDAGIARMRHLTRTMHQPVKRGAVITPDLPWEVWLQTRCAPQWDSERKVFKIWLIAATIFPAIVGATYAESEDGIHWTKPILHQYMLDGSDENNFVTVNPSLSWPDNTIDNVVCDPRDPDSSRRYKGLGHCYAREPLVSPDGIHWRKLAVPAIPSGDESNLNYDPQTGTFLLTVKTFTPEGHRAVSLSTSQDFEHWSEPALVFRTDALDQAMARRVIAARLADPTLTHPAYTTPADYAADVYNMPIFRYEGLYIALPAIFQRTAVKENDGFQLVQLICSRDLHNWTRVGGRRPFIGPSRIDSGAYDLTQILPPSCPILRGNELWFYYTGLKYRCGAPEGARDQGAVCLAVLRRDGFVSLDAGEDAGTVVTRPFVVTDGELHLNVDATHGEAQVQIRDERGALTPGFEASETVTGDRIDAVVRWPRGNLRALAGRKVQLGIILRKAQFYSYWLQ